MPEGDIESISRRYAACLTRSCSERGCGLQLDVGGPGSRVIVHGTKYQKTKGFTEKLCDRIVFCRANGLILAAVELKGGGTIRMSQAIAQIQNGLRVANDILEGRPVDDWVPLLLYSGRMRLNETRLLQNRSVQFRGQRKVVEKRNCGTPLSAVLPD